MPRKPGSGNHGRVRSLRLPRELDAWFNDRLREEADKAASEVLLELVHGGLRLKRGYMIAHRNKLIAFIVKNDRRAYCEYRSVLRETFADPYVIHLEEWLKAEGFDIGGEPIP